MRRRFRVPEIVLGALLTVAVFAMGSVFGSLSGPEHKVEGGWWHDAVTDFTLGLVIVGVAQALLFLWQLKSIRETIGPARKAAEAARLNAQAVMDAEGAILYPSINQTNLDMVGTQPGVFFRAIMYRKSATATEKLPTPTVTYHFKNYGKTPAILKTIRHNIEFIEGDIKLRTLHVADERAVEIIGAGQESEEIRFDMLETFNMAKATSVLDYRGQLLFHGEAVFTNLFNQTFKCIWEFEGRPNRFRLIRHEHRQAAEDD